MTALLGTRTPADVPERLDALASVVELGSGRLDAASLDDARAVLARAGERLRLSSHHTVVALAGATGSGKSSLFNALAGAELSRTGVRRPTTSVPHACVWGGADGAGPLLERLGVGRRATAVVDADPPGLDGLIVVDLPDVDSTERKNRATADRLLELVDLFVWVVDPQKYADAVLHEEYLRPLAGHADVTVVAFNQVDRVGPEQLAQCLRDLDRLLEQDGLAGTRIVATSARTGAGLAEIKDVLADTVQARAARTARLAADLDRVVDRLGAQLGEGEAASVGRRERGRLLEALEAAAGVPAIASAAAASYRAAAARATGWPVTRWAGRLRRDPLRRLGLGPGAAGGLTASQALPTRTPVARAQVELAVRGAADAFSAGLPPTWATAVRRAVPADDPKLAHVIDEAVTGADLSPPRRPLWWRALNLLQVVFVVALIGGLLWLAGLFALEWFRIPEPPTPDVGPFALPTVLVAGGVAGGLLVALIGRLLARVGGRRRARQVRRVLHERLADVAADAVLGPMRREVEDYARVREALAGARRRR